MKYKLKDLVTIKYGKNQKLVEDNINGKFPILGTGGIIGYAKEPLYNKSSVLIGRKGTIDKIRYVDYPFWTIDTLFYTEINTDLVIPQYLYYRLLDIDFKNLNEGTTIPSLRTQTLYEIELEIEDIKTQNKIVDILSTIDKKIKYNTHTNNNLQELLLLQYKLYFDNKEANGKLKDIVIKANRTIKKDNINKLLKYYPIDILPKNNIILQDGKDIEEAQSSLIEFKNNEILVGAMRVYFHRVCLSNNSGITRNTTFVLKPISDEYLYYSLLTIYQDPFIDYASLTSKGTTMPYAVWENVCSEFNIYIPTKEELQDFNPICKALIDKMNINQKENTKLESIRNTLLPKLMNGEIDLDKIEI